MYQGALQCALWMHGDSRITIVAMLLSAACLILARLPYEQFPRWMRVALQCLIVGVSFLWLLKRWEDAPMDLCVSEASCLLLTSLFLARTLQDHLLLWGASLGLACYGTMTATRPYFAIFFAITAAFAVIQLYATRTLVLAQARQNRPAEPPARRATPPCYWMMHLALAAATAFLLTKHVTRMPQWNTMGIIPVSFRAMQSQDYPVDFGDWMTDSSQYENTDAGRLIDEATVQGNPFLDPNAAALANLPDAPANSSQGTGAGLAIGTDLVFRAFSGAKLYWMVQAYDLFDGTTWSRSPYLESGRNPFDLALPDRFANIVQKVTIYKPASDLLPFQYAPRWLRYSTRANGAPASRRDEALIRNDGHLQYRLSQTTEHRMPSLPWHYTVASHVALSPENVDDPAALPAREEDAQHPWLPPPDQRGYHFRQMRFTGDPPPPRRWRGAGWPTEEDLAELYLQLPQGVVTDRMVSLARGLTRNAASDLEKATILRNYLRENYTYTLQVTPPPAGTPPLDYFLFESRQGFCQHFAQALVFLARAVGLRSRLVTGYSPGNYNVLTNYYEIYEYHAHAWTQIFIERYGWLTFDGTPPGALDLQNTPAVLAATRNAFDETWTPAVPETAYQPQPGTIVFSRTNPNGWGQVGRAMSNGLPGIIAYLFGNKRVKYNKPASSPTSGQASGTSADAAGGSSVASALLDFWQHLGDSLTAFQQRLAAHKALLGVLFGVALALWFTRERIARVLRRWHRKFTVRRTLKRLRALPATATARRIEGSIALADTLMEYCHQPRPTGRDAAEHAADLQALAPEWQPHFQVIAHAALQNHFAATVPPAVADEALAAATRLTAIAMPQIDG